MSISNPRALTTGRHQKVLSLRGVVCIQSCSAAYLKSAWFVARLDGDTLAADEVNDQKLICDASIETLRPNANSREECYRQAVEHREQYYSHAGASKECTTFHVAGSTKTHTCKLGAAQQTTSGCIGGCKYIGSGQQTHNTTSVDNQGDAQITLGGLQGGERKKRRNKQTQKQPNTERYILRNHFCLRYVLQMVVTH